MCHKHMTDTHAAHELCHAHVQLPSSKHGWQLFTSLHLLSASLTLCFRQMFGQMHHTCFHLHHTMTDTLSDPHLWQQLSYSPKLA